MTRNILIVTDNNALALLWTGVLDMAGYFASSVASAEAAIVAMTSPDPDLGLVITSLDLPKMKGDKLSLKIKEMLPDMPVILITSGLPGHHACKKVLEKPISNADFVAAVKEFLLQ